MKFKERLMDYYRLSMRNTWQLNAIQRSELYPFTIKDIFEANGGT